MFQIQNNTSFGVHANENLHISKSPVFLCEHDIDGVIDKKKDEHKLRKMRANAVGYAFIRSQKHGKLGARMLYCGHEMLYKKHSDKTKRLVNANSCNSRSCPRCQHQRSKILYGQTTQVCENILDDGFEFEPVMITLTVPNVRAEALSEELKLILKGCNRLMKYKAVKDANIGFIRNIEVTYNKDRKSKSFNTYHPHVHILIMMKKGYFKKENGLYITHKALGELWMKALGIKDYKRPYFTSFSKLEDNGKGLAGMVGEVAKYCTKPASLFDARVVKGKIVGYNVQDEVIITLHEALKGRRLITFGGIMKKYRALLDQKDVDDMKDDELIGETGEYAGKEVISLETYSWSEEYHDYVLTKSIPYFESEDEKLPDIVNSS